MISLYLSRCLNPHAPKNVASTSTMDPSKLKLISFILDTSVPPPNRHPSLGVHSTIQGDKETTPITSQDP